MILIQNKNLFLDSDISALDFAFNCNDIVVTCLSEKFSIDLKVSSEQFESIINNIDRNLLTEKNWKQIAQLPLEDKFIIKYFHNLKNFQVLRYNSISEETILKLRKSDYQDFWHHVLEYSQVSEQFIRKYVLKKYYYKCLCYQKLSEQFILDNFKTELSTAAIYQKFSEGFINKHFNSIFIKYFDYQKFFENIKISEELIIKIFEHYKLTSNKYDYHRIVRSILIYQDLSDKSYYAGLFENIDLLRCQFENLSEKVIKEIIQTTHVPSYILDINNSIIQIEYLKKYGIDSFKKINKPSQEVIDFYNLLSI
jgi:hypothetical protein